jgi:hypothetical protein
MSPIAPRGLALALRRLSVLLHRPLYTYRKLTRVVVQAFSLRPPISYATRPAIVSIRPANEVAAGPVARAVLSSAAASMW